MLVLGIAFEIISFPPIDTVAVAAMAKRQMVTGRLDVKVDVKNTKLQLAGRCIDW